MLYSVEIGKNVLILRGGRGLSQEELADRAGISVSRLRDIEHGYANASIDVLESVAVALDTELPTPFLLSLEEERSWICCAEARQSWKWSSGEEV